MDGWMYGCMDAWMHGCMDVCMDGWMDTVYIGLCHYLGDKNYINKYFLFSIIFLLPNILGRITQIGLLICLLPNSLGKNDWVRFVCYRIAWDRKDWGRQSDIEQNGHLYNYIYSVEK